MITPKTHPEYESPRVVTYQEDEILKQMGPVGGCNSPDYNPGGSPTTAPQNLYRSHSGRRGQKYRSSLRSADLEDGLRRDEEDL